MPTLSKELTSYYSRSMVSLRRHNQGLNLIYPRKDITSTGNYEMYKPKRTKKEKKKRKLGRDREVGHGLVDTGTGQLPLGNILSPW